jgi:hypothetical protein
MARICIETNEAEDEDDDKVGIGTKENRTVAIGLKLGHSYKQRKSEDALQKSCREIDEVVKISNKRNEDMNKVIEQLTAAITQSKSMSTLSKASSAVYVSTGNSLVSKLRRHTIYNKNTETRDDHSDTPSIQREFSTLGNFYNPYEKGKSSNRPPNPGLPFLDSTSPGPWYLARKEEKQTSFRDYRHKQYGDFISRGKRTLAPSPGKIFTLEVDMAWEKYKRKEVKRRRWIVLFYKSVSILLLLASFILAIIFINVFIS